MNLTGGIRISLPWLKWGRTWNCEIRPSNFISMAECLCERNSRKSVALDDILFHQRMKFIFIKGWKFRLSFAADWWIQPMNLTFIWKYTQQFHTVRNSFSQADRKPKKLFVTDNFHFHSDRNSNWRIQQRLRKIDGLGSSVEMKPYSLLWSFFILPPAWISVASPFIKWDKNVSRKHHAIRNKWLQMMMSYFMIIETSRTTLFRQLMFVYIFI